MKQEHQSLTAQAVILRHIEKAARRGDVNALKDHILVYQAIIGQAKAST